MIHYNQLLDDLKFDELEEILIAKPFEEMQDILYGLAYDPDTGNYNLLVYTFVQHLLYKKETWQLHLFISQLIGQILNHIDEKAESIGLYHGLRAHKLNPDNAEIMEYLLYFNHIPERLLDDSTAIQLASKVVKVKPESLAAMMTLSKL